MFDMAKAYIKEKHPEESDEEDEDVDEDKSKTSWLWIVVAGIIVLILLVWIMPNGNNNPEAIVKVPIEVEKWKLVTIRYYNITPTEKVGGYYPLLLHNYDGELCKNDPENYTEYERENIVRCPYRWEIPERVQIRFGDSIIVREDDDCEILNLSNCRRDFSHLLTTEALLVNLLNETVENRTYKVTEIVSKVYNGTDWVAPV